MRQNESRRNQTSAFASRYLPNTGCSAHVNFRSHPITNQLGFMQEMPRLSALRLFLEIRREPGNTPAAAELVREFVYISPRFNFWRGIFAVAWQAAAHVRMSESAFGAQLKEISERDFGGVHYRPPTESFRSALCEDQLTAVYNRDSHRAMLSPDCAGRVARAPRARASPLVPRHRSTASTMA